MTLLIQLGGAKELDDGVWRARLSPSDLRFLHPKTESRGAYSVLLLTESPAFDRKNCSLAFAPSAAKILNAGTSEVIYVISGAFTQATRVARKAGTASKTDDHSGDLRFLESLPPNLGDLGAELLAAVRGRFPGDLSYYHSSRKFVEAPDNFWTIKPQPRDKSFRITVRGKPETFLKSGSLTLRADMPGYSSLKIKSRSQIGDLINILAAVRRK